MKKEDCVKIELYVKTQIARYYKLYTENKIGEYFLICRISELEKTLKELHNT